MEMWRRNIVAIMTCLISLTSFAQSAEDMDRIMKLTGQDSPEDLDEHEVERLSSYLQRPVRINVASVSYLRSCGLFSPYQVASLFDYRMRHGDVMSYVELASVDGFTDAAVQLLMPFISLEGGRVDAKGSGAFSYDGDVALRGGLKFSEYGMSGGYGLKYRGRISNALTIAFSASRSYDEKPDFPDLLSGHIMFEPPGRSFKFIAGDFNARFGQGLALWNGMSMTGLSKAASFFRSASGLSSSWSFTGSSAHTGVAGEYSFSRMRLSALVSLPGIKNVGIRACGILPAVNVGWYGRNMSMSLTHYLEYAHSIEHRKGYIPDMKTSADIAVCIKGTDVFSEFALDWVSMTPAALAGVRFPMGEDLTMSCHARYYPASFSSSRSAAPRSVSKASNEYGISLCCEYMPDAGAFTGGMSADAAYLPVSKIDEGESLHLKVMADGEIRLSDSMVLKFRLSERFRTWGQRFKTDLRSDLAWSGSRFSLVARLNAVRCAGTGFLAYVEGGYKTEKFSIYLKQLFFLVDNWDDRIYSYERDAPGNFSVPAFYGRGINTAMALSWKFSRWGKLYANGSMTSYPFMRGEKKKPGKAELEFQFVFSF